MPKRKKLKHSRSQRPNAIIHMTIGMMGACSIAGAVGGLLYMLLYAFTNDAPLTQLEVFWIPVLMGGWAINAIHISVVIGLVAGVIMRWQLQDYAVPLSIQDAHAVTQLVRRTMLYIFIVLVALTLFLVCIGFFADIVGHWQTIIYFLGLPMLILGIIMQVIAHRYIQKLL